MATKYQPTIGLEVHAELKTRTKMFCDSLNDPEEERPNTNVCPVCLGHPGAMPVPNREAVAAVIKTGLALGGRINETTKFDRKNYFYPDLPKGYQISQYDKPLVEGGTLNGVHIRRIHLEEDTGTLIHANGSSLVDYNRSGVPLMELVTEPDLRNAEDTANFARELQLILRYLGVSEANMEKGEMRIEANVSLNMGTKVELKNINSFKAVFDAVNYELKRQEEAIERGEKIHQETRGWDEAKQRSVAQRSKEEAHDYRYFPEPDIPPFKTAEFGIDTIKLSIPEMPAAKRERFAKEYKLDSKAAEALVGEPKMAQFFEEAVSEFREEMPNAPVAAVYHYLTSDLRGLMNQKKASFEDQKVTPDHLAHLAALIEGKRVTSRQAKDILAKVFDTGVDPHDLVAQEGIGVATDANEVEEAVREIIGENPAAAADFKKGKTASLQFLIGKAMGKLKGRARPDMLKELFEKNLG